MIPAETERKTGYEAPQVVDYGDLLDLTAAGRSGDFTDAFFPHGTPVDQFTFSN